MSNSSRVGCLGRALVRCAGVLALIVLGSVGRADAQPAFVQVAYSVPQTPQATVTVRYPGAQTAGNLNVVIVGWDDATSQVTGVSDTSGNAYTRAVGPTVQPGIQSQVIYYAANIAGAPANTNTVTVSFNVAVSYPDVRTVEYRGVATANPLDVVASKTGTGSSSTSGAVATTNANDLLVGANYVRSHTKAPGSGYVSRLITEPNGSIVEDRVVTTTGSYSATATVNGGAWVMQLVAFRAAGGIADTQAPSVPTTLTATAVASTQINLTWTASTDNVGVAQYRVERCTGTGCTTFAEIGTAPTASFSNTGLTPATSYRYRVRAQDAAGNLSGYAATASATTPAAPDTQAPSVPTTLTATAVASTQINLTWTASTDNVGVAQYRVERCTGAGCTTFAEIGTAPTASFSNTGLTPATSYSYRVRAQDAAGNLSGYAATASATTPASAPPQITFIQSAYAVPQTPQAVVPVGYAGAQTAGNLNVVMIGWNDATSQVTGVSDTRGNVYTPALTPTVQPGIQSHVIYYAANIVGAAANTNTVTVTFNGAVSYPDVRIAEYQGISPVNPVDGAVGGSGTGTTSNSGTVVTTNATDLLVAANYVQTRSTGPGAGYTQRLITEPNGSIVEDRVVTAPGSYSATASTTGAGWVMQLVAFRAAGGIADTQAPSVPTTLTATAVASTQINLTWTASTDNVGVAQYRVERCTGAGCTTFAEIGTAPTASFSNTGLTPATSYSYRVRAQDAAGNLSGYAATASATTPAAPDTQAPSVPTNLTATAVASTQINLTWTASTDNVGVTQYRVERCTGTGCTTFAEIGTAPTASFSNTGLTPATSYSYRVRAQDAAGNLSGYAATASATTPASAPPQITFIQSAYAVPQTPQAVVPVGYAGAQTAGNLNVVMIGWNDATSQVTGVSDTRGNVYTPALTPTVQPGIQSHVIYYAANIVGAAANTNTVTVTFNGAVSYPDVRIAEYQGISPVNPVDGAVGGSGTGTTSNSGTVVTTNATDLLVAANYVQTRSTGPGAGYTQRLITEPNGSIVEDRVVTAPGSYSATASTTGAGWVMQLVAFRAAGGIADTQAPSVPTTLTATAVASTQINLTWTASTDNVGVAQYRVERCTGAGCTTFAEIGTAPTASFSNTGLTPATSYSYRVRAQDAAGNLSGYAATASATTPASAPPQITFIQSAYAVPQTPQAVVPVGYAGAQTAGNLNVVMIGWNDATSQVTGVSDTRGNVYTPALTPTVQPGIQSHVIYYAANIVGAAANTNTVTVTFNGAVSYPDVRIAEYQGISPVNPVDGAVGGSGTGTTSNSGTVVTTNATDLLVAANYVQTRSTGPGAGYTQRLITEPNGSIVEDRVVTAPGSYSATASTTGAGWVMQLVAFRAAGGIADTQAPSVPTTLTATAVASTQINLTWTASTDNVGVTQYRVERCTGTGCTTFAEIGTAPTASFSSTGLTPATSYSYRVRAQDAAGNLSGYAATASATTPTNTSPTITIMTPDAGDVLSGTATFGANVSGAGIGGVQFQVDGVNVGPVTQAPYSLSFDTAQFPNGGHSIGAYTWDNTKTIGTAVPVSVTFSNVSTGNPSQTGLWSGLFNWPLVSVHINLSPDGRVLVWDKMDTGNPHPHTWDPVTSALVAVPTNDGANLFCAGHITLRDGRILSVGGHALDHVGLRAGRIFNPATSQWTSTPDMAYGRWYPTLTTLPDGRILTLSGEVNCAGCYADVPEIYNPVSNTWSALPIASRVIPYYPHAFVLPDGRVLVTGTAEDPIPTYALNLTTQTWSVVDSRLFDAYSSAMYLPGKILKSGKSTDSSGSSPSVATAYVIDMNAPSPAWRQVASMAFPRAYHVETLLPDGNVLVTGGGRTTGDDDVANAVFQAELWSSTTETWTTLASMQAPRLYHGSALLLPDGRVLVSGGGRSPGPSPLDQENAEIFAPPYLFKGPRPTISSAPTQLTHNGVFQVQTPDVARIAKVSLVAVGNMTHGINMNQRYLPLSFSAGAGSLTVTAPSNANLAPPGWYMLFLVDNLGVPSLAAFVRF